jgi:hypothetical protein
MQRHYDHHSPQRYAVFHAHDLRTMMRPQARAATWYTDRPRAYTHVADVEARLSQVFQLTNHIDHAWTSNPQVVWAAAGRPLRSTSVGDILLCHQDGRAWLVMPVGLEELPPGSGGQGSGESAAGSSHPAPTTQRTSHFPFGLARVVDYTELWRRYTEEIPLLAQQVTLPMALPCRHPALSQLEGRYPVEDRLPPWWEGCVDALARRCPCLEPLLRATSREEFRRGSIDQQRWRAWRRGSCRQTGEAQRPTPCWTHAGPGLSRLLAEVLATDERPRWLDRFVARGAKELPPDLDLVVTAHLSWWLNMANGRNWFSCMGTGPDRDLRLPGNWYDPGVALAALVARGDDCWTPGALIARTTLRVVTDDLPASGETDASERPTQRVVLGRVYHNDLTSACALLSSLIALFEDHRLPWGCIAGTTTAELALDGSLGALDLAREPHQASGVPYWLPADIERPALEGQVAYLERGAQENAGSSGGRWTYPSFGVHACQRRTPAPTASSSDQQ